MEYSFVEENLPELLRSARETWNDPVVQAYLKEIGFEEGLKRFSEYLGGVWPDDLVKETDRAMKSYASCWANASRAHTESGLYRQVAEAYDIKDGLVVDLGCGSGGLLAELPHSRWIGVDVNHYCLQAAEQNVRSRGKDVGRHSESHISFDPELGFLLKPKPCLFETDFSKGTLMIDDLRNPQNILRLLYNNGARADAVAFTLWGGVSSYTGVEFIDMIMSAIGQKKNGNPIQLVEDILKLTPKICRKGGRLLFAERISNTNVPDDKELVVYDKDGKKVDIGAVVKAQGAEKEALMKKYESVYELEDVGELPVTVDETKYGISVTPQIPGYSQKESQELLAQAGVEMPIVLKLHSLKLK